MRVEILSLPHLPAKLSVVGKIAFFSSLTEVSTGPVALVRVTSSLGNNNEEQTGPQPHKGAGRGGKGRSRRGANSQGRRQPGQGT